MSDDELDGVVLFDPSAPSSFGGRPPSGGRRALLPVILVGLVIAAALGAYATRDLWAPVEEVLPPEATMAPVEGPQEPSLEPLTRTDVTGPVGSSVVLAVRALGTDGPLADSSVVFRVTEGAGVLLSEASLTDARGIARAELSLPTRVGTVGVTATLPGTELWTEFSVQALPGPAARIAATEGDRQVAEVNVLLPDRMGVTIIDSSGNPVPGVEVRFSADAGMVAPDRRRTDAEGVATSSWRLGIEAGTQRFTAQVPDLDTVVTFTATATARPAAGEGRPTPIEAGPVTVVPHGFVVGGSHVCTLANGAASCRGARVRGQSAARSSGLVALATGVAHVCGLGAEGAAVCWGANEGGQLGDGSRTDREAPVAVRTELRFSMLTAGAAHTCGLAGGGVPICWGQNLNGQLGDGSRIDQLSPRAVGGGLLFTSLVAGWNHTCGLTDNGNAFCWGLNSEGQLGDGSRLDQLTPTLVRAPVASLVAGQSHTCGISGQQVLCWGDNRFGQLGDGTTDGRVTPVSVQGLPGPATQLASGAVHTCALTAGGAAYCWGQNLHGQLGDGSTRNSTRATAVTGDLRFRSIYAGGALTCGFSVDGSQYCWGLNQSGQLGDGTRESRATPTLVP